MFTSAATGLAVGIAFIRGLTGRPLGNFYIDITRSITRILRQSQSWWDSVDHT